ncbi:unnamed protein product [Didymodactylos carnosus]|uniref:Uncharacterized protein n=1 Tax=Didymodactylos carnosus TaxID=1234261 RepID=A0A815CSK7_9BILA|nr:unnamed protein product [Didymodactylos carnosus]CAF1286824.1 unnamed protein product [Didymodactylos carnosus]CAF3964214.1 unnamed protein product [Didymodactylos carnosus]CAF4088524.1 unnamed protein product [Didymodactylos carnosus]
MSAVPFPSLIPPVATLCCNSTALRGQRLPATGVVACRYLFDHNQWEAELQTFYTQEKHFCLLIDQMFQATAFLRGLNQNQYVHSIYLLNVGMALTNGENYAKLIDIYESIDIMYHEMFHQMALYCIGEAITLRFLSTEANDVCEQFARKYELMAADLRTDLSLDVFMTDNTESAQAQT